MAFTGGTLTGRKIQEAAARSNLKSVTLELGGKNPNIIFDDANLEQAVKWAALGLLCVPFSYYLNSEYSLEHSTNQGQVCVSGSRIFVQEGIYDEFLKAFTKAAEERQRGIGDPFATTTLHGPQTSKVQFEVRSFTRMNSATNCVVRKSLTTLKRERRRRLYILVEDDTDRKDFSSHLRSLRIARLV